jgi:hypothetical protein
VKENMRGRKKKENMRESKKEREREKRFGLRNEVF